MSTPTFIPWIDGQTVNVAQIVTVERVAAVVTVRLITSPPLSHTFTPANGSNPVTLAAAYKANIDSLLISGSGVAITSVVPDHGSPVSRVGGDSIQIFGTGFVPGPGYFVASNATFGAVLPAAIYISPTQYSNTVQGGNVFPVGTYDISYFGTDGSFTALDASLVIGP